MNHIIGYRMLIETNDFTSFTTSRIKVIYNEYKKLNHFLETNCDSLMDIEKKTDIYDLAQERIKYVMLQEIPDDECNDIARINRKVKAIQERTVKDINKEGYDTFNDIDYKLEYNIYSIFFPEQIKTLLNSLEAHSIPLEITATTIRSTFLLISSTNFSNLKNFTFLGIPQFNTGCLLLELI